MKVLKNDFLIHTNSSNQDINKFILLLQKVVYPYEYVDYLENSKRHQFLKKEIYTVSHLDMEDITDEDYTHEKEFEKILT